MEKTKNYSETLDEPDIIQIISSSIIVIINIDVINITVTCMKPPST